MKRTNLYKKPTQLDRIENMLKILISSLITGESIDIPIDDYSKWKGITGEKN